MEELQVCEPARTWRGPSASRQPGQEEDYWKVGPPAILTGSRTRNVTHKAFKHSYKITKPKRLQKRFLLMNEFDKVGIENHWISF